MLECWVCGQMFYWILWLSLVLQCKISLYFPLSCVSFCVYYFGYIYFATCFILLSFNVDVSALTTALEQWWLPKKLCFFATQDSRISSDFVFQSIRRTGPFPWQQDLFEDSIRAAGIQGVEVGTKLYISNLDHGVTNEDIRELFSEIGDLKRCVVHYDKTGHPSGSAEVVYTRRSDAFSALKRYNNVLLDGKPMKIEIVGANAELPITARVNVSGVNGRRKKRTVVMMSRGGQTGGGAGLSRAATRVQRSGARPKGGTSSGRGRVRSRGRGRVGRQGRGKKEKSAEELDKELETYHAEAMNIS
ncbi:hypothetical protein Ahy_A07g032176 isoform B [Arachis hypogaea]|uniref:RRM domain-containing protein n=1 Tax=Arachis hypogaea TaxID=3818 RepID=A0A445C6B5_ARAHY|nr:hypothetical protein Ahy_A07g032176 isoform A [Arachis hypogaea]RYR46439.1 hypothetical protein Ahy_A07g032176 isoform B [Arachis hypogaea]